MGNTSFTNYKWSTSTQQAATEIKNILDEQARGWNEGNAKLYAQAFAEDGCFTNIFGMFHIGYAEFMAKHERILAGVFKGSCFDYRLVHLQFINDDTAVAETLIVVSDFTKSGAFNTIHTDEQGRMFTRLLQVFSRHNGVWKIASYHNVDVKAGIEIPVLH